MPKLKKETIEERYRIINDKYQKFSYLITRYGIDNDTYSKNMPKIAAELRLELKKFI